jgi:hypothetical protein
MRFVSFVFFFAFVALLGSPAQSAPSTKPDFAAFAFLEGSWSCTIVRDADAKSIGQNYPFVVTADPSGFWFVATTPHTKRYLGYDSTTKKWSTTALTTDGKSYADTSPGWSGNTIVFTDAFNSDGSPLGSTTLTKVSEHEYTMHGVSPSAQGQDVYDHTCRKP